MAEADPWAEFRAAPTAGPADDPWAEFRPAPAAPPPGVGMDIVKSGGIGLAKGAVGLAGLPGDLGALRDTGIDKLHRFLLGLTGATPEEIEHERDRYNKAIEAGTWKRAPKALTSGDIQGAIEKGTGPFYEPQTTPGHYAQTVGEFVPAAMTGGEGLAANLLKGAVAPAVGSEALGSYAAGSELEGPARFAGALMGGGVAHGAQMGINAGKTVSSARNAAAEATNLIGGETIPAGAVTRMAKDVRNDSLTPELAAGQTRALGPEAMMMDMGRQLLGRAEAVATQPGKGQNTVLNAVEGRTGIVGFDPAEGRYTSTGEGTAGRVQRTLDRTMGPSPDVVQTRRAIEDETSARAKPLYDEVMGAHPVVDVPANITSRPAVSSAMKNATTLARHYGEELESPTETRTILKGPGYHIAEDTTAPAKTSLRYWDYVKKDMDRRINSYMKSGGTSELGSADKADLGGLIASRNALRDHLDEATGGAYKKARDAAADKPQLLEALDQGRAALNTKLLPEELAEIHDNMSVPQQDMLRAGMHREIERIIDTARNDASAARGILDTNQNREKIADIFGARTARAIDARIAAETKFQEATNKVAQSSRTGVRQHLTKDTETPSAASPPVANLTGFVVKGINKLRDLHDAGYMERTRNGLGAMSTTPAAKIPDLVRILSGYSENAAQTARPPVSPYVSTLARVLATNAVRGGQGGEDRKTP